MKKLLILLALGIAPSLQADTSKIRFSQGWIRHLPPVVPMRAGYLQIKNNSKQAHEIIAFQSEAFERVEMHETMMMDGAMSMKELDSLPLPANGTEELKPGGKHLMLIRPKQTLEIGQDVDVIVTFQDGTSQSIQLEVKK
mgnify:CR=1 FL=1